MRVLIAATAAALVLLLPPALIKAPTVGATGAGPYDPTPGCVFPPQSYWQYCWPTPYSGPYTQAWIDPLHYDSQNGEHDNLHMQPSGLEYDDFQNFHLDWYGVEGRGGGAQYAFYTPCSSNTSGKNYCFDWDNNIYGGQFFEISATYCLGDGYPCADAIASNMANCLITSPPICGFKDQTWLNGNFPNFAYLVHKKDNYGHAGTLTNAFCQVLNANYKTCSTH